MEEKAVNNQHVDNVLKSVSDEILAKKKRKRIISFSIITFLCFALVVTIVTMSVVRVNLKPYFIKPSNEIEVTIDSTKTTFEKSLNETNYNKVAKHIDDSFISTYLSALFAGDAGAYKIEESTSEKFYLTFSSTTGEGSGIHQNLSSKLGKNYVHFQYDSLQKLYSANGKEYTSVIVQGDQTIEYRDVYFTLSSEDAWTETTFYFGSCTNRANALLSITVSANTYAVYQFVNSLQ